MVTIQIEIKESSDGHVNVSGKLLAEPSKHTQAELETGEQLNKAMQKRLHEISPSAPLTQIRKIL